MTTPAPNDDLVRAGLEAAYKASSDYVMIVDDRMQQMLRVAIRAYLAASEPAQAERISVLERALGPFAAEADARKSKDLRGAVCFNQSLLIAARAALKGAR